MKELTRERQSESRPFTPFALATSLSRDACRHIRHVFFYYYFSLSCRFCSLCALLALPQLLPWRKQSRDQPINKRRAFASVSARVFFFILGDCSIEFLLFIFDLTFLVLVLFLLFFFFFYYLCFSSSECWCVHFYFCLFDFHLLIRTPLLPCIPSTWRAWWKKYRDLIWLTLAPFCCLAALPSEYYQRLIPAFLGSQMTQTWGAGRVEDHRNRLSRWRHDCDRQAMFRTGT